MTTLGYLILVWSWIRCKSYTLNSKSILSITSPWKRIFLFSLLTSISIFRLLGHKSAISKALPTEQKGKSLSSAHKSRVFFASCGKLDVCRANSAPSVNSQIFGIRLSLSHKGSLEAAIEREGLSRPHSQRIPPMQCARKKRKKTLKKGKFSSSSSCVLNR